jgi:D-xylose 1-dehydrogenase (NADP+, D-xylono-1,5-lactone-forming)
LGFYSVIGRKGVIEAPRGLILCVRTLVPEAVIVVIDADGRRQEELMPATNHYQLVVEAFADAILSGRPPPLAPSDSVKNAKALDAFIRSAREGYEVRF